MLNIVIFNIIMNPYSHSLIFIIIYFNSISCRIFCRKCRITFTCSVSKINLIFNSKRKQFILKCRIFICIFINRLCRLHYICITWNNTQCHCYKHNKNSNIFFHLNCPLLSVYNSMPYEHIDIYCTTYL